MQYIIGTGWWCCKGKQSWKITLGDDFIRSKEFHQLWYYAVDKYTNPEKICIVDSASPIIPDLNQDDSRIEWISLNKNYNNFISSYQKLFDHTGWMKGVLLSAMYALLCEVDYYLYIEQDCLVRGHGWVEFVIDKLEKEVDKGKPGWMFGDGRYCRGRHLLQQSLFIVKITSLWEFISKLTLPCKHLPHLQSEERFSKSLKNFSYLPFGYGRFNKVFLVNKPYFYAQHWSLEGLVDWCRIEMEDNLKKNKPHLNLFLEKIISSFSKNNLKSST